ncbi:hypothetical protein PFICI_05093 [Pestalotiopsis fici W106-1]|uniref:Gamma-glutamyltranspeptidase n=1 Tax=Pestalotiopsis fici (strain W106-1 / CGMCC3.15140) TaxID=1229662 RepID=W3XCS6_PESFW|nr:uncharacterized protein PFICI_05093 [Pestalotiopsis fici W106-1]ETS83217.1 hypothetical protein PFICI_05093 [Pestalotiopsis fici W106-1]
MAEYTARAIFPDDNNHYVRYPSRRSVVHGTNGLVACTQPLAAEVGQRVLKMGGNAADAAVAVAAAMNMTEPASTGIGGDMFCLYFDNTTKRVHALNGSGRSPAGATLEQVKKEVGEGNGRIPINSALSVTVPGAAAGWVDAVEAFGSGKLTLEQILMPAIEMGERGFPVSEFSASMWRNAEKKLKMASPNFREMLKPDAAAEDGCRAPRAGEIFRNPALANIFRKLAKEGKHGFYSGDISHAIIETLREKGSRMELSDLQEHMVRGTSETQPISLRFRGQNVKKNASKKLSGDLLDDHFVEIWEHPPNGQGIVALMALGILEELEAGGDVPAFRPEDHNSPAYLHAIIEVLRIAFADANWWVTDPDLSGVSAEDMTSRLYLAQRAKLFDKTKAGIFSRGDLGSSPAQNHSDTVYFAVTDRDGNAMSFINSNFREFGSCIIPKGCGFTLQNRGSGFVLEPEHHPNVYAPAKRPYHTIIPGLVTHGVGDNRQLHSVYGVMGGLMQPQGHVQVLLNMEVFGMNPQQALDAPRICIAAGPPGAEDPTLSTIFFEEGIDDTVISALEEMGHRVKKMEGWNRFWFGRGQVIRRHVDEETAQVVYSGGSDPRGDGCVLMA